MEIIFILHLQQPLWVGLLACWKSVRTAHSCHLLLNNTCTASKISQFPTLTCSQQTACARARGWQKTQPGKLDQEGSPYHITSCSAIKLGQRRFSKVDTAFASLVFVFFLPTPIKLSSSRANVFSCFCLFSALYNPNGTGEWAAGWDWAAGQHFYNSSKYTDFIFASQTGKNKKGTLGPKLYLFKTNFPSDCVHLRYTSLHFNCMGHRHRTQVFKEFGWY